MPVVDYASVWELMREIFLFFSSVLSMFGFGESGGRVMAAFLLASFFYLAGVFKKTRFIVGISLALAIILLSVLNFL